jgi:oxygen-independent coproporphyrinogen-3 oxidase
MNTSNNNAFQDICDPELLKKYDVSGPRYTSYPTAAQFVSDFGVEDFLNAAAQCDNTAPLSLYIHIPFCHDICYYCACNKIVTRDQNRAANYLQYLKKEMTLLDQLGWGQRPISQLHWGGGTPTFLTDQQMTELMNETGQHFALNDDPDREYSIEIDPRTISAERLKLLAELGFNRVSLGIQDFDPQVQEAINRFQSHIDIEQQVKTIRQLGFNSINFDLIYGLPFQTEKTVFETLEKVLALSPDRISCYNYAHLPERFKSQRSIDRQKLPSPEEKIRLISTVINRLTAEGYIYVGMDHFVKPDDTLAKALQQKTLMRNFQGYSVNLASDMLSLGVSAISQTPQSFSQNCRTIDDYYAALDKGLLPIDKGLLLSDEDMMRADIIQQITCHRYLDFDTIGQQYGINFQDYFADNLASLAPLQQDKIISINDKALSISEQGCLFLRHVAMAFDEHLPTSSAKYSKTI